MNDKTDRLLEAIEHPDHFSDEELEELLRDSDVRKIYDILRKTSEAMAGTPDHDIDREWKEFSRRLPGKVFHGAVTGFFSRHVAAVTVLVIVAAAVMVAATGGIRYLLSDNGPKQEAVLPALEKPARMTASVITDTLTESDAAGSLPEIVIFKDEAFDAVISRICEHYGATATFANQNAKELRLYYKWDQSLPLPDVVNELNNFEQLNITLSDNVMSVN